MIWRELKPFANLAGKPLLASWMGGADVAAGQAILSAAGVPTFEFPDQAAKAFTYMWRYAYNLRALGGIIQRYALTDRIGPVAIVAATEEAFRQASVFAAAATAERPLAVFREQAEAVRWLIRMVEGHEQDAAESVRWVGDPWDVEKD